MKISEMTNDQATDALIRMSTPFGNICDDDEAVKIIEQLYKIEEEDPIRIIGRMLPQITGYLLKTHKDDLYEIIGALTVQTKAKVAKMNFFDTLKVVKDSYDEVLQGFFTSSASRIKDIAAKSSRSSSSTDTTE